MQPSQKNNTAGYWETDEVKAPHNRSLVNVAHFHRARIPPEWAALVLELRVSSNTPALPIPDVNHRLGVPAAAAERFPGRLTTTHFRRPTEQTDEVVKPRRPMTKS